jgi:uncharacterized membrane protein YjjP (DUF1212 family)
VYIIVITDYKGEHDMSNNPHSALMAFYGITAGASFAVLASGDIVKAAALFALATAGMAIREGWKI